MKRIAYILLFLCCLPFMAMAQDLNPGQQSQGLLESRNVTVDHSTGIFHYRIPLYTVKSGDYELPISLRYAGKGVKVSDEPGLVGYNWTLDTGGVVTRTVRGGIPDESYPYGYLQFENDPTPLSEDATRVNRHKRDGECDIFTAVFGGKSVNFIIRKAESNYLSFYADPLERTDVRIECVHSNNLINGWVVIDNDGTRYTYMRKEWTANLNKRDEISFNGLSNLEYASSWHLTKIEPVNSEVITFEYLGTEVNIPTTSRRRVTSYRDTCNIKYNYGRPMEMPMYEFETYRENFEMYYNAALADAQQYDLQIQELGSMYVRFDSIDDWPKFPNYDFNNSQRMLNQRVLGMGDFSQVSAISKELLALLHDLAKQYEDIPNNSASYYFTLAHNVLQDCVNGVVKDIKSEREVKGGSIYKIIAPVLASIKADETVVFQYGSDYNRLLEIAKRTKTGNNISAYDLSYSNKKLRAVTSLDKDSVATSVTSMTYYTTPAGGESMEDVYGFRKQKRDDPDAKYHPWAEEEYTRIHSLKEIRPADGGKICLDYELNGFPNAVDGIPFGGIRIKSIVLDNPIEGRKDTIIYHYEQAFHTFWDFPVNYEEKVYKGFTDEVSYSKIKTRGHAILSPGNNGIYYPIVHEKITGQGTRSYFFNFTDYALDWSHSHWLNGLPVFTVEKDEEGYVKRMLQNFYYTDKESGLAPCLFLENLIHLEAASYNKVLPQMVADEEYMDLEDMREEMNAGPEGGLQDANTRAFWTNIAPRIRESYQTISYSRYYGGATVLAEQREYRPAEKDYTDFWELMYREQPYSRTVYHYDSLDRHIRPTRIVSYDASGDSTIVHQVYADDMAATASGAISAMKEANILSPMVKRAVVKNGELQEEEVTVYGTADKEDGCFYAPEKVLVRKGGNGSYTPDTLSLYSGSVADYQERKKMTSTVIGDDSYLPTEMTEQGTHTAFVHDPNSKWCILQTIEIPSDKVIAVDAQHYRQHADPMERILFLATKLQEGIESYDPESIQLDNYQEFCSTKYYGQGKELLEALAKEAEPAKISVLLDSCAVDFYIGIEEYITWQIALELNYFPAEGISSPWNMTCDEMYELQLSLMTELWESNGMNLLDYLHTYRERQDFIPQTLAVPAGQANYNLHLVPMEENAVVTYTIVHNGGTTEKTVELFGITQGALRKIPLDLGGYANVMGITVTGFCGVRYLALVPEGTEFKATSYNEDGTLSVNFDHRGKMRHHEYDSAGRLVSVCDENGKIQENSDYHVKNTNL